MQLPFGLLLLVIAAIVQATALDQLFAGARPDLVLLLVLAWSMNRGLSEGAVGGIAGGLALDLLSAAPFGLHAGLLVVIGALTALGESNLFRGSLAIYLTAAALATVLMHGGALLVLQAAGQQTVGFAAFVQIVVPTAALNAVLMPLTFVFVQRTVRALGGWRQLEL